MRSIDMNAVIFDTNAYRCFVTGKSHKEVRDEVLKINTLESDAGIVAKLSIVVLSELLKHLTDKTDPSYQDCKLGVIAAMFHCGKRIEADETIPYLPFWDQVLHFELTGQFIHQGDIWKHEQAMMQVGCIIAKYPSDFVVEEWKQALEINKDNILRTKKSIYDALMSGLQVVEKRSLSEKGSKKIRKGIGSFFNAAKFESTLARVLLESGKSKFNLPNPIDEQKVIDFKAKYLPVIRLHQKLYLKINNGIGIRDENHKEFNTFLDAFIIGSSLLFEDCILVTNERLLTQCFVEVGMGHKIKSLDQYLNMIGYNP